MASDAKSMYMLISKLVLDYRDPEDIPLVVLLNGSDGSDAVYNVELVVDNLGEGPVLRVKLIGAN